MKLIKKIKKEPRPKESDTYIDLGELEEMGAFGEDDTGKSLKVAEIHKYEDLHSLVTLVYSGHFLLIDYSPVASDDLLLKRITAELKQVARDINGDVAGLKKNLLVVAPGGFKVDRKIIRGGGGFYQ
jgi:SepF-like predicted cell division protein (DUF552 family)